MPKGRPQDYRVPGKPSSGVKPSARKRALPTQASATAKSRAMGAQGAMKRKAR